MAADFDPYAPPAEEGAPEPTRVGADYASERRPVGLLVLLCIVTFGVYPVIWLFRRRRFLDALDADAKLGTGLPSFVAASYVLLVGLGAWQGASGAREAEGAIRLVQLMSGIGMLVAVFRVASILRSDFNRSGRFLSVSGVATFFFGTLYLQYKINEAADTTPLKLRKKKKKKKKPEANPDEPDRAEAG